MNEDEIQTTETTPVEPEPEIVPETEPEPETDPIVIPDNEDELKAIDDSLNVLIDLVKAELQRQGEERESQAIEKEENALAIQEKEKAEIVYKEDMLTSLGSLQELTTGTTQAIESISFPDYSDSYVQQQEAMDNQFLGINVLIGLVLGIAVAVMFVKGLAGNE